MTLLALITFATLLVASFGFRTLVHLHRTGTSGWLMPTTLAGRIGDTLFVLGALGTCLAPALVLADVLDSMTAMEFLIADAAGVALLFVGSSVALAAQAQMGTAWRAGIDLAHDYQLVTHGVFRVVRNPFYSGICTASLGVWLIVPTIIGIVATLLLMIGCTIDVRLVEEPHLRSIHGTQYDAYAAATPRFLPAGRRRP
jgi:protein-S-isoprenylcysteine O-methyltransferase Ste14